MDNFFVLILVGFSLGTLGTLIGAGGGFILVPLLLITHSYFRPETVTAISMAVVGINAISGSIAYGAARRIDYRAGIIFALFTIPGSILGVYTVRYISKSTFDIIFGILLLVLAAFLILQGAKKVVLDKEPLIGRKGWRQHEMTDRVGETYKYSYNQLIGIIISVFVGYISPLLGIGGGIIHVPAMVHWLRFPVHIATATSHFILAIMATVSVITHAIQGSYILHMIAGLGIGVVGGAQVGAYLSDKLKGHAIIRALAVSLAIVGVRLLMQAF
jgi:uncharacterized protein